MYKSIYIRPTAVGHELHTEAREYSNWSIFGDHDKYLVSPNLGVEVAENVTKTVCVYIGRNVAAVAEYVHYGCINSITVSIVKNTLHKYLPGLPVLEAHWALMLHLPCDESDGL